MSSRRRAAPEPGGERLSPPAVVAAIDVGGTDTKLGAVTANGTVTATASRRTPLGQDVVTGILDLADEHVATLRADGVDPGALGIVVPGIVDEQSQRAVYAANLGWRDVPFTALLRQRLAMPVRLGHDVRAAGLAELNYGAARGETDAAVIVIGTGIAAALFAHGQPIRSGGHAGEIGHSPLFGDGELCACGSTGCLETVASAGAIARRYNQRTGNSVAGAAQVLQAARGGDADAIEVWDGATAALARAIAQLAATLAPRVVVLGGGLAAAGADLLDPVSRQVRALLTVQRLPELRLSTIGTHAGILGAGVLATEAAQHQDGEHRQGQRDAGPDRSRTP